MKRAAGDVPAALFTSPRRRHPAAVACLSSARRLSVAAAGAGPPFPGPLSPGARAPHSSTWMNSAAPSQIRAAVSRPEKNAPVSMEMRPSRTSGSSTT